MLTRNGVNRKILSSLDRVINKFYSEQLNQLTYGEINRKAAKLWNLNAF